MLFSASEGVNSMASLLLSCTQTTPLSGYRVGGNPEEEDPSNYADKRKGCMCVCVCVIKHTRGSTSNN